MSADAWGLLPGQVWPEPYAQPEPTPRPVTRPCYNCPSAAAHYPTQSLPPLCGPCRKAINNERLRKAWKNWRLP